MRSMRRIAGVLGAVAAAALFAVPAGAGGAAESVRLAHAAGSGVRHSYGESGLGAIVLGLGRSGAPFAFTRDGAPRGFELDLAEAVAEKMGVALEVRWMRGEALIPALEAGEVDLVNLGAVRGGLPAGIDVVPTLLTGEHVMVRLDNPFAIGSADDLSGTMVVATMGSAGEGFARELQRRVGEGGRVPVDVHTMPMAQYTPTAVLFAHASAYFAPTAAAALQAAGPEARVKVVAGLFKPTGRLGFAFRVGDAELKRDLRLALASVVAGGDYDRLLARYHIPKDCSPFR